MSKFYKKIKKMEWKDRGIFLCTFLMLFIPFILSFKNNHDKLDKIIVFIWWGVFSWFITWSLLDYNEQ